MQLGMQFPIYSLIQAGFPSAANLPPQIPLHMQMYVGPPQHHHAAAAAAMLAGLSVPTSLTSGVHHQAAGFPFPGLSGAGGLAGLPGSLQLFPNVSEAGGAGGPRFNLSAGNGGPMLHLALPGVSLPLLPTPPPPSSTSQHQFRSVFIKLQLLRIPRQQHDRICCQKCMYSFKLFKCFAATSIDTRTHECA